MFKKIKLFFDLAIFIVHLRVTPPRFLSLAVHRLIFNLNFLKLHLRARDARLPVCFWPYSVTPCICVYIFFNVICRRYTHCTYKITSSCNSWYWYPPARDTAVYFSGTYYYKINGIFWVQKQELIAWIPS